MTASCVLCGIAAADVLVLTADRAEHAAGVRVDQQGELSCIGPDGAATRTLKLDDVWVIRFDTPDRFQSPCAWLRLRDGRCLRGDRIAVRSDELSLEGPRPLFNASFDELAAVFFHAAGPMIDTPPETGVRIISANGDIMHAPTVELTPAGAVVDINPDVDPILFPAERLSGVIWSGVQSPQSGWQVALRAGERWVGTRLMIDAEHVVLSDEGRLHDAAYREVSTIVRMPRRLRPLDELIPTNASDEGRPAVRVGLNGLGAPLRIASRFHRRGIGLRGASSVAVSVPAGAKWFVANVGADADGSSDSRMMFRIARDGDMVFTCKPLTAGDAAVPVAVSVEGAKQLVIHLEPADEQSTAGLGDVVDAIFVD